MTEKEYVTLQQSNIDKAITLGKELLRVSADLHGVADDANADTTSNDSTSSYMRDAFKYYDFNTSAADLYREPALLNDFKQSLIDIKIANDKMLFEGGYRKDLDEAISRIFLSHTLCKIKLIDEKVLETVVDALETLEKMKAALG